MKKLISLLMILMMIFSLTACGGGNDDKTSSSEDKTPSSTQQQEDNEQVDASVTGNGEWPKKEWTSPVPEADGTVLKIDENMETGMGKAYVIYMDWTDDDALAYQQKLVDAGKIESVGTLINDVYYMLFTDPKTGRMVMINEVGETENDYVIVLYK